MVSGMSHRPDDDGRGAPTVPHQPSGAGTPPPSSAAHSASTSGGSAGSPSSRSDHQGPSAAGTGPAPAAAAVATASTPPASDGATFLRLNSLDINGDDAPSSQAPVRFVKPASLALPDRVSPSVVF
jgi:transcription factor Dp-1